MKHLPLLILLFCAQSFACESIRIVHSGHSTDGNAIPSALLPLTYVLYVDGLPVTPPEGVDLIGAELGTGGIEPLEVECSLFNFQVGVHLLSVTAADAIGNVSAMSDSIETTIYSSSPPDRPILQTIEITVP